MVSSVSSLKAKYGDVPCKPCEQFLYLLCWREHWRDASFTTSRIPIARILTTIISTTGTIAGIAAGGRARPIGDAVLLRRDSLTGFGRGSPVLDLVVYLREYAANDQSASL